MFQILSTIINMYIIEKLKKYIPYETNFKDPIFLSVTAEQKCYATDGVAIYVIKTFNLSPNYG